MNLAESISGEMLIGGSAVRGTQATFRAIDPSTNRHLEPQFAGGGQAEVDRAAELAAEAFDHLRSTSPEARARLLERIAHGIDALGEVLLSRAQQETGLTPARLKSERSRTTSQLQLFSTLLRDGATNGVRIDTFHPRSHPAPRPDIRQRLLPVGPVAIFGASNFPLAFSCAGGDTAAALAAGCPVIVKVHNAHPGTDLLVGRVIAKAVAECGLPEGMFSVLLGYGDALGAALVAHPAIKAVGFTGSRTAGTALSEIARTRPEPIPVYAEMSSLNPVIVLPSRATLDVAADYVDSFTLGSGQFCTSPGVVFVPAGPAGDMFVSAVRERISSTRGSTMLTPGICESFERAVAQLEQVDDVEVLARGEIGVTANAPRPIVFLATARRFESSTLLRREVFGPASLIVRYASLNELLSCVNGLDGQLTGTIHATDIDSYAVPRLLSVLERKVGRVVFNGWPTGVEVGHAIVHGGPFPATSDGRSTSVGTLAISRFQRPVAYQDIPDAFRPVPLRDANPWSQVRLVNGDLESAR